MAGDPAEGIEIRLEGRLPFVSINLAYQDQDLDLHQVLVDTGSAGSVFSADVVSPLGLLPAPQDPIRRIHGVGGSEFVYSKRIQRLSMGSLTVESFQIQIGSMDYGFPIEGIVGIDFLRQARAVIDLGRLRIYPGRSHRLGTPIAGRGPYGQGR